MHFYAWHPDTEVDDEAETEEVKLAQSLLDEARVSSAYARLAALIDAVASYNPDHHGSMLGSNQAKHQ